MSLAPNTKLGPYEILSPLGAGGMGEVYRARDSKLGREVAIKVLPEEFSQHPQKLARFEREARLLATLNHPGIATIYEVEESEGKPFLVMELVEGQTLAERISLGPIPVGEALEISRQIAEALEAAHEKGVIHRDLKPANIKVDPEGHVKVLDFGLAKAFADEVPESELSQSPTLSRDATRAGVILGTAAYMSPEQAKGKTVDKRTDIFSFGIVLYEMLTGQKAFQGEDVPEVLASIIGKEPDWKAVPSSIDPRIQNLLRRCLRKDRKKRLRDTGDIRNEIEEILSEPATAAPSEKTKPRAIMVWQGVAGGLAVAFLATLWTLWPTEMSSMRLSMALGAGNHQLATPANFHGSMVALSPDGKTLAFVGQTADGDFQIFLRSLASLEATPLSGTEGGASPFFSPDGQSLAFFTSGALKKVSVRGGAALAIAEAESGRGGAWGPDGSIVYTPSPRSGLYRVPASGGTPVELTQLSEGEESHRWPWFLPNGEAVLFMVGAVGKPADDATIEAVLLETGERKVLHRGGAYPRYAPSGHLLYAREATLFAIPLDLDRIEPAGEPGPVIEGVLKYGVRNGATYYTLSGDGSLVYVPDMVPQTNRSFVWVDREGLEEPVPAEPQSYNEFALSPDGGRVAVRIVRDDADVWVYDLVQETWMRLTFDRCVAPMWSPDGTRVAFGGNPYPLSWKASDGTGESELLVASPGQQFPQSFSPDGAMLVFEDRYLARNLSMVSLEKDRVTTTLFDSEFIERNATLSPDGRWMAYESNESGRFEVYVAPFPDVHAGRWQVSNDGGAWPLWSPDGREVFYLGPQAMMSVAVETEPALTLGRRETLFDTTSYTRPSVRAQFRRVAIAPDGQRFLMLKEDEREEDSAAPASVILVQNWFEELKQLVPTN